jgi:hypothetical protein
MVQQRPNGSSAQWKIYCWPPVIMLLATPGLWHSALPAGHDQQGATGIFWLPGQVDLCRSYTVGDIHQEKVAGYSSTLRRRKQGGARSIMASGNFFAVCYYRNINKSLFRPMTGWIMYYVCFYNKHTSENKITQQDWSKKPHYQPGPLGHSFTIRYLSPFTMYALVSPAFWKEQFVFRNFLVTIYDVCIGVPSILKGAVCFPYLFWSPFTMYALASPAFSKEEFVFRNYLVTIYDVCIDVPSILKGAVCFPYIFWSPLAMYALVSPTFWKEQFVFHTFVGSPFAMYALVSSAF